MKQLVEKFSEQLRDAMDVGERAGVTFRGPKYSNVVVAGMGGSGVAASLIQSYVADKLEVPLVLAKGYTLPSFVGANTLVIASSFSGNTEEILSVVREALKADAAVGFLTAGGELLRIAQEQQVPHIRLDEEPRQPRALFGYAVVDLLYLLHHAELLDDTFKREVVQSINLLEEQAGSIKVQASALASALQGKVPMIYASSTLEPVALRLQQQLNSNAKQLAHVSIFPEVSHNEIEGWQHPSELFDQLAVLFIKSVYCHPRVKQQMDLAKPLLEKKVQRVLEIEAMGATFLEQAFYLIHLFDWVSIYMADLNKENPNESESIAYLKRELSKV
ncbi:bifunctional phosphoglucose/phosphomannose isomerase [Pontibacter akesuensis]|uniref:Bifunctional phosphoglucose/phosphomannose isomerase n=1 Tax=Pontibacter akesuensis TaxID=388950 RepID=A0A1I7I922_9BACT|nr:bifunctional phosphoglucose/phosphomannose isomerase [Pontibacter akesuensis]GHA65889.1 bifunctional phosphoglucose/phosphomannose isomerase [Pontibacter akesuensis]SFU69473.1 bifunctional phosphoglucose/phosphomannose isomerase [Pontibacter akesuensis]